MRNALRLTAAMMAALLAGCSPATAAAPANPGAADQRDAAMRALLDYVRAQKTTGLLIQRGGETLVERNWPAPDDAMLAIFLYGKTADGALLEDVASQQKSFVSVLVGVAIDKGLIDVDRPVSDYIGTGWSRATPAQEKEIRVLHILQMNSGLDENFAYVAPAGTQFFYNTAVYAVAKRILTAAARQPLDRITRDWLTGPAGMADTAWRQRPAALADVGNPTGLVTSPRDTARFGRMILAGGVAEDGTRILSQASLNALFARSATNPAYGRLWWLNGGDFTVGATGRRRAGPLVAAAPADLVAALGFLDRRLYIVPSLDLVVVRTGADAPDADFDEQLWRRLMRVLN
ncbi:serine hydrolase domain-containing protein [Sphingopyxis indica]|uniref:CubicO group peptidase, beta-lactamase class C family n=1 Tax=Sphingopyxis indica TaxID=436663 RepID=A0A239G9P5_9SPHN|nr:serine hydrolase [Sphingopyxis indica]WOF44143.1 serine hydrolase [Sphingopyxis indica]SNS65153.1 CubicO group peptidase, beta-lactamase class C family [Sphingopyxis indica]